MSFPIDLVLVRHGESEGNYAQHLAKHGDNSLWTPELQNRHTSKYRLTDLGIQQARITGTWIRANFNKFDRYYCSEYNRAMETAAYLDLDGAEWYSEIFLREQDKGVLAGKSQAERLKDFASEMARRNRDTFYYAPPGGESLADCALRVESWLNHLGQTSSGLRVICVCHGNIIKAIRIRIEKIAQKQWSSIGDLQNCEVIHYTRRNPDTGKIYRTLQWVRRICPWNLKSPSSSDSAAGSGVEWRSIVRPVYSNEDFKRLVAETPRLVNVIVPIEKKKKEHNENEEKKSKL